MFADDGWSSYSSHGMLSSEMKVYRWSFCHLKEQVLLAAFAFCMDFFVLAIYCFLLLEYLHQCHSTKLSQGATIVDLSVIIAPAPEYQPPPTASAPPMVWYAHLLSVTSVMWGCILNWTYYAIMLYSYMGNWVFSLISSKPHRCSLMYVGALVHISLLTTNRMNRCSRLPLQVLVALVSWTYDIFIYSPLVSICTSVR